VGALAATAFLVGLAGGVHCVAMCGGIVAALNLRGPRPARAAGELARQFGYSLGRIASYSCAGAVAGGMGSLALLYGGILPARVVLLVLANALIILLGLYLAGWGTAVLAIERAGGFLWRGLRHLGARLEPRRTPLGAVGVGLVWGWIPCGLVYSALAMALVSGSWLQGAAVMGAFGLGTLPNLLAMGLAAQKLQLFARRPRVRLAAGLAVVLIGLVGLARVPGLSEHLTRGLHGRH
jgi:sulfite exporter TauE/SafE